MTTRRHARPPAAIIGPRRVLALVLTAMLVFGAALAIAGARGGRYAGKTSEGGTATLTISPNGRTITHFKAVLGYNGKCGQGGGPGLTAAPARISIGADGRFTKNVTLTLANAIHDPGRVFGRASGAKVTGTVEQFLHGSVNKCYVESFTARHK
jgi:hypothetical protein